jgi:hypothetical protein
VFQDVWIYAINAKATINAAIREKVETPLREESDVADGATAATLTFVLPTGLVTPLSLSAVSIAGPTLKKSTRRYVGARPYVVVHSVADVPKAPVPPDAEFVVLILPRSGDSMVVPKRLDV